VEETSIPGEKTDLSQVTDRFYHIMLYQVHLVCAGFDMAILMVILYSWYDMLLLW